MRPASIVVKRTGALCGNPSLALRVSEGSSASPTREEVVVYIITWVYGSYALGLS